MAAAPALIASPPPLTAEENTDAVTASNDLTPLANQPLDIPPSPPKLETLAPPAPSPSPPLFLNSIAGLKDLSASISVFLQCYDDLNNHLQSIKAAISAKMPPETPHISQPSPKHEILEEIVQENKSGSNSELESLCKTMCSRGLRKYIIAHLSDLQMLREEVPKALRLAPNPSKLVLECLGKFYMQGSRAFVRNSPMIPGREATILVLECFVLMMGLYVTGEECNAALHIDKTVKEETDAAAFIWRKRMVTEGGLARASQIDARGLLLFVACFGIPALFKVEDIRDLLIAGNATEIAGVLQKSHVLMSKIAEIVEEMTKKKMGVDAVDIVYTFGLEERFNPQTILISFLRESKESWKKTKEGSHGSAPKEAKKNQLATLKSISKCLEKHSVDPSKLLPGWKIREKISTLEKSITDFFKKSGDKTAQKRKSPSEPLTSNRPPRAKEAKRPRHVGQQPHQQRPAGRVDNRRNLSDNWPPKHTYSAPAVIYGGPGAGLLPESMIPTAIRDSSHGGIPSQYAVHEGVLVDASGQRINHGTHHHAWHGDSAINERYTAQPPPPPVGLTSLYRASTSVESYQYPGHANQVSTSDIYQFSDSFAGSELYPSAVVPAHLPSHLYQP